MKKPEPCKVVSMDSLRRIEEGDSLVNEGPIVSYSGSVKEENSWKTIERPGTFVELSQNSWKGLHNRLMESREMKLGVV